MYILVAVPSKAPNVTSISITATSISISWMIPNDSVVVKYVVMWEKGASNKCNDVDKNSTTVTNASTSYNITGLEEWSNYTITLTASNSAGNTINNSITVTTNEAGE